MSFQNMFTSVILGLVAQLTFAVSASAQCPKDQPADPNCPCLRCHHARLLDDVRRAIAAFREPVDESSDPASPTSEPASPTSVPVPASEKPSPAPMKEVGTIHDARFRCNSGACRLPPQIIVDERPVAHEITQHTNSERTRAGLGVLAEDEVLMKMAREHSESMARLEQLSHTIEGRSFSVRLNASGYALLAAGENIAEGQTSAREAVGDWMNSPGHRQNIMNGQYTRIGVAVARGASGRNYFTQVFARPAEQSNQSNSTAPTGCRSCRMTQQNSLVTMPRP